MTSRPPRRRTKQLGLIARDADEHVRPSPPARQPVDQARAVANRPGSPLGPAWSGLARGWFGTDFSDVRVHADVAARDAAEAIDASAYTVGRNIVFRDGVPARNGEGMRLVAHELAHVLQHRESTVAPQGNHVSDPADPAEREADAIADRVVAGTMTGAVESADAATEADDGDSAPGGPILSVASSPFDLDAADGDAGDRDAGPGAGPVDRRSVEPVMRSPKKPTKPRPQNRDHQGVPTEARRWITKIDVSLGRQSIRLTWSDGAAGKTDKISSGRGQPCTTGDPCPTGAELNCTPTGTFHPQFRGDAGYVNGKGDRMSYYVDLGVRNAQGDRGIGIHNSQLVTGSPRSHGCIRVADSTAKLINENVITSTVVEIGGKAPTGPHADETCPPARKSKARGAGGSGG